MKIVCMIFFWVERNFSLLFLDLFGVCVLKWFFFWRGGGSGGLNFEYLAPIFRILGQLLEMGPWPDLSPHMATHIY
jgi:hypothetical protein